MSEAKWAVFAAGGAGVVGSFAIPLMHYGGAASVIATAGGQESYDHLVNSMGIAGDHIIRYRELKTWSKSKTMFAS